MDRFETCPYGEGVGGWEGVVRMGSCLRRNKGGGECRGDGGRAVREPPLRVREVKVGLVLEEDCFYVFDVGVGGEAPDSDVAAAQVAVGVPVGGYGSPFVVYFFPVG